MHLIVYSSDYTGDTNKISDELNSITKDSQHNNPKQNITGALFFHQGKFLQLIEGSKDNLEKLMTHIATDPRHNNINRLIDQSIAERKLPNWNMDSLDLDKQDKLDQHELKLLTDVYTTNLIVNTDALLHFYKAMLKSRKLFNQ